MHNKAGLYLHIPFCEKKCAYCDFYSVFYNEEMLQRFIRALICEMEKWGGRFDRPIDTIYLGGGTPSILGSKIGSVIEAINKSFNILKSCEITAEINPNATHEFLEAAYNAGVNRLSMGVQSGIDRQLKKLGRNHTTNDAKKIMQIAREIGYKNISLDLMLALPNSNIDTLKESIDFLASLEPEHISAYILKIEENTKFFYDKALNLPDEEQQAQQYLFLCDYLKKYGYYQYEISNFSKKGYESKHNLKYWNLQEYLGIGPSAHSFIDGKRFYYQRDLKQFIQDPQITFDGEGGGTEERLMLSLRLNKGIDLLDFTKEISSQLEDGLKMLSKNNLIERSGTNISLTPNGMLVSNSIITNLTELIYEDL